MNLCPCGGRGDPRLECSCTPARVAAYRDKVSRALLDRFDLVVAMPRPRAEELAAGPAEPSAAVRDRVAGAERLEARRPRRTPAASELLDRAVDRLPLTGRATRRVARVARTIAALAGSPTSCPSTSPRRSRTARRRSCRCRDDPPPARRRPGVPRRSSPDPDPPPSLWLRGTPTSECSPRRRSRSSAPEPARATADPSPGCSRPRRRRSASWSSAGSRAGSTARRTAARSPRAGRPSPSSAAASTATTRRRTRSSRGRSSRRAASSSPSTSPASSPRRGASRRGTGSSPVSPRDGRRGGARAVRRPDHRGLRARGRAGGARRPGEITSALSPGTNALLRQGATPATCAADVLEALGVELRPPPSIPDDPEAAAVLEALDAGAATPDELVRATPSSRRARSRRRWSCSSSPARSRSRREWCAVRSRGDARTGSTSPRSRAPAVATARPGRRRHRRRRRHGLRVRARARRGGPARSARRRAARRGGRERPERRLRAPRHGVALRPGRRRPRPRAGAGALALDRGRDRRDGGARRGCLPAGRQPAARGGRGGARGPPRRDRGPVGRRPRGRVGRRAHGPLAGRFTAAIHHPTDGALQPARSCAGSRPVPPRRAPRSWRDDGSRTSPSSTRRRVVVATDGYPSGLLGELEGLIVPTRGQVIATEPLPERLFEVPHYGRHGFDYWHQAEDGRLVAGGFRDISLDTSSRTRRSSPTTSRRRSRAFVDGARRPRAPRRLPLGGDLRPRARLPAGGRARCPASATPGSPAGTRGTGTCSASPAAAWSRRAILDDRDPLLDLFEPSPAARPAARPATRSERTGGAPGHEASRARSARGRSRPTSRNAGPAIPRSWIARPVESKSVAVGLAPALRVAREHRAERRSRPHRGDETRRRPPASSPPWLACSQSSQKRRARASSSTATSALPGPSAPISETCWPGPQRAPAESTA